MKYTKRANSVQSSALLLHKHSQLHSTVCTVKNTILRNENLIGITRTMGLTVMKLSQKNNEIKQNILILFWGGITPFSRNIKNILAIIRACQHIYVLGKASLLNRRQIPILCSMNTYISNSLRQLDFIQSRPLWMHWIGARCALVFFYSTYLGVLETKCSLLRMKYTSPWQLCTL